LHLNSGVCQVWCGFHWSQWSRFRWRDLCSNPGWFSLATWVCFLPQIRWFPNYCWSLVWTQTLSSLPILARFWSRGGPRLELGHCQWFYRGPLWLSGCYRIWSDVGKECRCRIWDPHFLPESNVELQRLGFNYRLLPFWRRIERVRIRNLPRGVSKSLWMCSLSSCLWKVLSLPTHWRVQFGCLERVSRVGCPSFLRIWSAWRMSSLQCRLSSLGEGFGLAFSESRAE
jgi:hypothetical protein